MNERNVTFFSLHGAVSHALYRMGVAKDFGAFHMDSNGGIVHTGTSVSLSLTGDETAEVRSEDGEILHPELWPEHLKGKLRIFAAQIKLLE